MMMETLLLPRSVAPASKSVPTIFLTAPGRGRVCSLAAHSKPFAIPTHLLTCNPVTKIKADLIHKAKVKKEYAKIKAREPPTDKPLAKELSPAAEPSLELHPDRQAMLDAPELEPQNADRRDGAEYQRRERRKPRKPAYFEKEMAIAEQKKAEAEARRLELERREKERAEKRAEREKQRAAMAKARSGGKGGQRKLGRESKVLLDKVKKIVDAP